MYSAPMCVHVTQKRVTLESRSHLDTASGRVSKREGKAREQRRAVGVAFYLGARHTPCAPFAARASLITQRFQEPTKRIFLVSALLSLSSSRPSGALTSGSARLLCDRHDLSHFSRQSYQWGLLERMFGKKYNDIVILAHNGSYTSCNGVGADPSHFVAAKQGESP